MNNKPTAAQITIFICTLTARWYLSGDYKSSSEMVYCLAQSINSSGEAIVCNSTQHDPRVVSSNNIDCLRLRWVYAIDN